VFRHIHVASLVVTAALALSACRDRPRDESAATDSALVRDLTLASSAAAPTPELRDVPDSAPPVEAVPLEPAPAPRRSPAPVRAPVRVAPKPVTRAPDPVAPPVIETPAPAPAPARPTGVIAAGTSVGLTLDSRACSDANRPGDKLIAHTSEAVTGTNGVVFPAGSPVVIEVATVVQNGAADSSTVTFRVKSITANGVTHVVTGDVIATGTLDKARVATQGADKKKVVGGAILGAIIGRVAGGGTKGTIIGAAAGAAAGTAAAAASAKYETCVPAGAPLRMTIGAPVVVDL
jgi:hypothetical protein